MAASVNCSWTTLLLSDISFLTYVLQENFKLIVVAPGLPSQICLGILHKTKCYDSTIHLFFSNLKIQLWKCWECLLILKYVQLIVQWYRMFFLM